jgi:branched-subunit amino acid ABC-type transport system permease component
MIFNQFVSGLIYAALLFVIASGLVLTFGALRIINLAHASLYMVAAYMTYSLVRFFPDNPFYFFSVLLITCLVIALVGILIEVLLLRLIYRAEELLQLVLTFGLVWIFSDVVRAGWGVGLHAIPRPRFLSGSFTIFGHASPTYNLMILATAAVVAIGLWFLFYRTNAGIVIRAMTDDPEMSSSLGVNIPMWRTMIFALGSALAGLGGAIAAPLASLELGMDMKVLNDLFIVIIIGGMGSFPGAMIGAFILGQLNAFGILIVPKLALIFGFVAMAVVLLIRPWGLLGRPE